MESNKKNKLFLGHHQFQFPGGLFKKQFLPRFCESRDLVPKGYSINNTQQTSPHEQEGKSEITETGRKIPWAAQARGSGSNSLTQMGWRDSSRPLEQR